MITAKIRLSIFRSMVFLEKRNHAPIKPNIIKTETKLYDILREVVICSATESVSGSRVVRKGFMALRYLNPGRPTVPLAKIAIADITKEMSNKKQFRICFDSLLNFLINSQATTNIVGTISANPT